MTRSHELVVMGKKYSLVWLLRENLLGRRGIFIHIPGRSPEPMIVEGFRFCVVLGARGVCRL